jgi:hypothetical protein
MSSEFIDPVLGKVIFGNNVSASRVIDYVRRSVSFQEKCGMISDVEASEIVKHTEEKLKLLK